VLLATPAPDLRAFAAARFASDELLALALATVWCGAMTCAYTIWAQSYGQFDVSPARANLIYTSQPIFSSFFAALLVHETPTPAGLLGGALIIAAVVVELQQAAPRTRLLPDGTEEDQAAPPPPPQESRRRR